MRRIVAGLLLLGVLAGCSDDSPDREPRANPTTQVPTTAPGQPARPAPRPKVGSCYRMSYEAALAPTSTHRPVRCARPHSAQTYYVGELNLVVDGHLLAVDSDRAYDQLTTTCRRRFAAYVGGSVEARRLSMLVGFGFGPTLEQAERGASWFRCDIVAQARVGQLALLRGDLRGVLDSDDGRRRWGRCATARPGNEDSAHILCARNDAWRAVATVDVSSGKGGKYPGVKAARRAGAACQDKVRAVAESPFNFEWGYEWPTAEQWEAGQRWGFCWTPG